MRAKGEFVKTVYINGRQEGEVDELFKFYMNFTRYSERCLYFAENVLKKMGEIEAMQKQNAISPGENYLTGVESDVWFEFDAFVISAKSIFEGNIIKWSKNLETECNARLDEIAKEYKKSFIDPFLVKIRDEVIHINNYGSALGSLADFDSQGKLISLRSGFYTIDNKNMDLIELYFAILDTICKLIDKTYRIMLDNIILTTGEINSKLKTNWGDVCIEDFSN